MLAKGLRTHSLYIYTGYILSYIKIVYKPRNIPVQVKDGCRLLMKIILFIEHFNIKEILVHGLYSSWKHSHFSIGLAQSICCAMMQLTGAVRASSRTPHAHQHPPVKPTNRVQCCLSSMPCYKKGGFLANGTNHLRRISLIT